MALTLLYAALLAFIPYFVAVWRAPRLKWQRWRWAIVGVAIALRAAMLPVPPVLSLDVYRYCWEGKVQKAGFDPYRLAPDALELAGLRDANWQKLDHREVPSVYPPLLLQVFRAGSSVSAFKWMFTGFDLATLWFLVKLLRARGQNQSLALIWAWNPLVILEFAGQAHAMSMAICLVVAALWLWETNRRMLAAIALAGGVMSQFLALPIAVAITICRRDWRMALVFAVTVAAVLVACPVHWQGLTHLAGRWRFNGSVFETLVWLLGREEPHQINGVWVVYEWPKRIAAGLLAGILIWTAVRRYRPSLAARVAAGATLLLSSTVHPWYVTWLVALSCAEFSLPWLTLSAFVVVSYVARVVEIQTGIWVDAGIVRWMEYGPFTVLWLVDSVRRRQ